MLEMANCYSIGNDKKHSNALAMLLEEKRQTIHCPQRLRIMFCLFEGYITLGYLIIFLLLGATTIYFLLILLKIRQIFKIKITCV